MYLDGVAVRRPTRGVDDLVSQALGDGLDVAEGRLARARGHEVDGLVDAAERRHVDGLPPHNARAAHARRVLPRTAVDDGVYEDLHGVLVREDVDELERVLDDAHRHDLLAVVAPEAHHAASQALHNGAAGLPEALALVSAGGVCDVRGVLVLDCNEVL